MRMPLYKSYCLYYEDEEGNKIYLDDEYKKRKQVIEKELKTKSKIKKIIK